jgi:hypothetical protein
MIYKNCWEISIGGNFSDLWQSAQANFPRQIREHLLHSKLLLFASLHVFVFPKIILSFSPSEAVTIFINAFGCGTAAYYTKDCLKVEHTVFASAQRVELYAVIMVLRDFPQQPINLYSDSHYVVGVLRCIETAYIGHTSSEELFNLFFQLHSLVQTRLCPSFVSHLHSHSDLPGPCTDSNSWADNLVSGVALGLPMQTAAPIDIPRLSHAAYHQNASALSKQFISMPLHMLVRPLSMSLLIVWLCGVEGMFVFFLKVQNTQYG